MRLRRFFVVIAVFFAGCDIFVASEDQCHIDASTYDGGSQDAMRFQGLLQFGREQGKFNTVEAHAEDSELRAHKFVKEARALPEARIEGRPMVILRTMEDCMDRSVDEGVNPEFDCGSLLRSKRRLKIDRMRATRELSPEIRSSEESAQSVSSQQHADRIGSDATKPRIRDDSLHHIPTVQDDHFQPTHSSTSHPFLHSPPHPTHAPTQQHMYRNWEATKAQKFNVTGATTGETWEKDFQKDEIRGEPNNHEAESFKKDKAKASTRHVPLLPGPCPN